MKRTALVCTVIGLSSAVDAQSLPVTADAVFTFNGQEITISRSAIIPQDNFDIVSRAHSDCPSPCLSPMNAAPNVVTMGELDMIDFLSGPVEVGDGLLVDARAPTRHATGYIPASVNIPSATVSPDNPYRNEIFAALGACLLYTSPSPRDRG